MENPKKETKRKLKAHYDWSSYQMRILNCDKEQAKNPYKVSINFVDENDCFLGYSDQKYFATKSQALQFIKEFNH